MVLQLFLLSLDSVNCMTMSDLCRTDNSDFTLNEKNKAGLSALHLYSQYLGGRDGGYL